MNRFESASTSRQLWNFVLFPLPIKRHNDNERCYVKTCILIILLVAYAVLIVVCATTHSYTTRYKSAIITFFTGFNLIMLKLLMLVIMLNGTFRWRTMVEVKEGIETVDDYVLRMKKSIELHENDRQLRTATIVLFLLLFFGYFVVVELVIAPIYGFTSYFHTFEYVLPIITFTYMTLQYFVCHRLIANRFAALNSILIESDSLTTRNRSSNVTIYKWDTYVENVMDVHDHLSALIRKLNDYYGTQLVIAFPLLCTLIIVSGYMAIYSLALIFNDRIIYVVYPGYKLITLYVGKLILLVSSSEHVCEQANNAKYLLHTIRVDPGNVAVRNMIISCGLQLAHDTLQITACRLFTINFSLLFSICTGVTTYLLIMLQFDIEAQMFKLLNNNNSYTSEYLNRTNVN